MVSHPDRHDSGTIVNSKQAAWTPEFLTGIPPDVGMVKVRWSNSVDPSALFWEYADELTF